LTALWVFFFPWTREAREEDFSSPAFLLSLPLLNLKKTATQPPHLLTTWWKKEGDVPLGRFGATAQRLPQPRTPWTGAVGGLPPPSVLPINTEGGETEKGDKKRRKNKKKKGGKEGRERQENIREERTERGKRRKKERKRKKKQRRERKKDEKPYWPPQSLHRDNNTAATGSTASTPPQVTSCCPVLFPLAQPLPAFACRT
jgi:hypothetical protein